ITSGIIDTDRLPEASTTAKGIVQLNNTTNSTSTTQAATANAVRLANENASSRVAKSGDTMTGDLWFTGGTRHTGTSDNNAFAIRTNNTNRIYITSGGNVGIGTTSPSTRLHVAGDVRWTGSLTDGIVPWARLSDHPKINTGSGLSGGGALSGDVNISVSFGGNGTATTVARSDHNHDGRYLMISPTGSQTIFYHTATS